MLQNTTQPPRYRVGDEELVTVIADFLALGHVDNIIAMIRQESRYIAWIGRLLEDERYSVRIGVLVLLEELMSLHFDHLSLALPGLIRRLQHPVEWVRGEAASALGIIGSADALAALPSLLNDPSPQVAEIVRDILEEAHHG